MTKSRPSRRIGEYLPAVLVFLAFTAPGAWLVFLLPPVPISKALTMLTVAVWLVVFGLGLVRWAAPDKRIIWAGGGLLAAILVSFAAGGSLLQVFFYDLYSNMPLLQWLAFPAVFLLASGLDCRRDRVETALVVVVAFGALLASVEAYQQISTSTPRVFGSTGYSKAALAPLIPLAVWLGAERKGWMRAGLYAAGAVIALDVGVLAGSTMGAIVVVFALLAAAFAHPVAWKAGSTPSRVVRFGSSAVAVLILLGMLWVQVPVLSGRWVNPETLMSGGASVVSRLQMWQGAQAMVADKPFVGHGPGAYRIRAAEYLPAQALQYGPDTQGNIDPSVYSPQSPHSVMWEIATRLGVLGLAAFAVLLWAWVRSVVQLTRENTASSGLRRTLGAAFVTALFALSVDPVIFAIGLFAPVAAGLAVAPLREREQTRLHEARWWPRSSLTVAALVLAAVAVGLGAGEWRAMTIAPGDPAQMLAGQQSVLRSLPGHPPTLRQVFELRLLTASDAATVKQAQADIDAAPAHIHQFAPGAVSLVAYSLAQADRTGRTDLSWEDAMLARAEEVLPPIPSLVAERLHLAVLSRDPVAVSAALPDAQRWGGPYPLTGSFIERAQTVLGAD